MPEKKRWTRKGNELNLKGILTFSPWGSYYLLFLFPLGEYEY